MEGDSYLALLVFVVVNVLAASSGAIFRPREWYETLDKPPWRPPNWAFGPVWAVLYAMIAYAGWLVWESAAPGAATVPLTLYAVQLVLNALWSAIFFGMRRLGLALFEMAFLWLAILATIIAFEPVNAVAAYVMIPYLVWVSIAFCLNFSVWRRNPQVAPRPL